MWSITDQVSDMPVRVLTPACDTTTRRAITVQVPARRPVPLRAVAVGGGARPALTSLRNVKGARSLGGRWACAAHQQDDAESNPVVIDEEVPAELRRRRRTRNRVDAHDIDDASELEGMVVDKRARKRKNPSKARRRNRRYENRIERSLKGGTLDDLTTDDE